MFAHLARYHGIIVTGPQRAGTTFTTQAIAHDLGKRFVDESEVNNEDRTEIQELHAGPSYVLQCPCLCHCAHELGSDEIAVVLVRRPVAEILASQSRVNWSCDIYELRKYGLTAGIVSEVKYAIWDRWQKPMLANNGFEVQYHDLEQHPLWVDAERRRNFGIKQTRL